MAREIHFRLANFEGPLHLLWELVEGEQLPITEVALAQVTDQFLAVLEQEQENVTMELLADFLLVAARLMYLKSKVFLPLASIGEDDGGISLERQLSIFRKYLSAADHLSLLFKRQTRSRSRSRILQTAPLTWAPIPANLSSGVLYRTFLKLMEQIEYRQRQTKGGLKRVISLRDAMERLRAKLTEDLETYFHTVVTNPESRTEVVVTFLALLELVKQRFAALEQDAVFAAIRIKRI